jgi:4-amino-4-deoxy-L-arabinose transferase-like glycosyltransferase
MALLAVTLLVTSPFLYCFSRLAILEPLLTTLTLGALNLAVRLPRFRRPVWSRRESGCLFTLMMLTKTYGGVSAAGAGVGHGAAAVASRDWRWVRCRQASARWGGG